MLAVDRPADGATVVTVAPITHRAPEDPKAAVEMPPPLKDRLGLDHERSWVIVSEGNKFVWPGFDLRKLPGTDRFDYGFVPPRFFNEIINGFRAWRANHPGKLAER